MIPEIVIHTVNSFILMYVLSFNHTDTHHSMDHSRMIL